MLEDSVAPARWPFVVQSGTHPPTPAALLLVIGDRSPELSLCLRVDNNRFHGCCLRSSANTSSASLPVALP
jgi:hypothetical protein